MTEIAKTASTNIEAVGTYWTMPHEATLKKDGEEMVLSVPSSRVDSSMFSVFPFEWVEGLAQEFCLPGARAGVDIPRGAARRCRHYPGRRYAPELESGQC